MRIIAVLAVLATVSAVRSAESATPLDLVPIVTSVDGGVLDVIPSASGVEVQWYETDEQLVSNDFFSRTSSDFAQTFGPAQDIEQQLQARYPTEFPGSTAEVITNGVIHQVWEDGNDVFYRRSAEDVLQWSQPMNLGATGGFISFDFTGMGDHLVVVWDFPFAQAFGRHSFDGGLNWSPAVEIGDDEGFPALELLPGGQAVVAFFDIYRLTVRTFENGDFTETPTEFMIEPWFSEPVEAGTTGDLHVAANGQPVIIWNWFENDVIDRAFFMTSLDGGQTWEEDRLVAESANSIGLPLFASTPDHWYIAWYESRESGFDSPADIYLQTIFDEGQTFSDKRALASPTEERPSLGLQAVGASAITTWTEGPDEDRKFHLATAAAVGDPSINMSAVPDETGSVLFYPAPGAALPAGGPGQAATLGYIVGSHGPFDESSTFVAPVVLTGDLNCSGQYENNDIVALLQSLAGAGTPACPGAGDVDCDGQRTGRDVLVMLYAQVGFPVPFGPVRCARVGT